MPRLAYVNGRYVPHDQAAVHIEDRGFQFADGVYEVITIQNRRLVDEAGHLARLGRSLGELQMPWPMKEGPLKLVLRKLVAKNGVIDGLIYLQITRGQAPRDFAYPKNAQPTLVLTTRHMNLDPRDRLTNGVKVITIPDIRWKRRDIKTVSLLPQAMGKQMAKQAGAFEAWQVDDNGYVTEGCSSNAWIVTKEGVLVTRTLSHEILAGITRQSLIALAEKVGIPFQERAFTVDEAYQANEAFLSSATTYVQPITQIDDRKLGDGRPGALGRRMREAYLAYAAAEGAS